MSNIQEEIDANIHYQYFHAFCKSKEKELFHLDTEEAYHAYIFEKIKISLITKRFKNQIGTYQFDSYIKNKLKDSRIILNEKYSNYQNNAAS